MANGPSKSLFHLSTVQTWFGDSLGRQIAVPCSLFSPAFRYIDRGYFHEQKFDSHIRKSKKDKTLFPKRM